MCLIKIADYQGLQEVIPKNLFWIWKGNSGSKSLSYHFNALNLKSEVVGFKGADRNRLFNFWLSIKNVEIIIQR